MPTLFLLALLAANPAPAEAPDWERAAGIGRKLVCYCGTCSNQTIQDCTCGTARAAREDIRNRLARGESPEEIIRFYTDRYGEQILIAPTKEGFNLVAWITPFAALLAAGTALLWALRRWNLQPAPEMPRGRASTGGSAPADRELLDRIERELKELDG